MHEITFKNKIIEEKYNKIKEKYYWYLSDAQKKLINIVYLHFNRCIIKDYYFYFILIYLLVFFDALDVNSNEIWEEDRNWIKDLQQIYKYEINWEVENFIVSLMKLDYDIFKLKIIIKHCLLSFDTLIPEITDNLNYIKSIWYIIPILTIRRSKMLNLFQDEYFKRLFKNEYKKTKNYYLDKIWNIDLRWEYVEEIINDLHDILEEKKIMWRIKIRKKTYFSIYNKLKRKKMKDVVDIIWARIIFKNIRDLYRFAKKFEKTHFFIKKKDYIEKPKENWYQSLHYSYIKPYKSTEILVEIQLRTQDIDKKIKSNISDLYYTIKKKKWDKKFEEIHIWYEYMLKYIDLLK